MKNWTKYLLTLVLLFTVLLPGTAVAKDSGEVNLKVYKQNEQYEVSVYLNLPEEEKGEISSLHFKLYVVPKQGFLAENPQFTFADGLSCEVKNCAVTNTEDAEYCLDIVLSGRESVLTGDAGQGFGTMIGTIFLKPQVADVASGIPSFVAEVRFGTPEEIPPEGTEGSDDADLYVEYVNKGGIQVMKSHITNAEVAYVGLQRDLRDCDVKVSAERVTYNGSEQRPKVIVMDGPIELKEGTDYTVDYAENTNVGAAAVVVTAVPGSMYTGEVRKNFFIDKAEAPANKPEGVIEAAKSAKTLADVTLPEGWTWKDSSTALTPGETLAEAVAQYTAEDMGNYEIVEVRLSVYLPKDEPMENPENPETPETPGASDTPQTPGASEKPGTAKPGKQEKLKTPSAKAVDTFGTGTVKLSWKKVSGVSGYQVFRKDKKTGKYKLVKTINGAKNTSYSGNYAGGKTYTFKVRCFMEHEGSGKVYSGYSKAVKVTVSKFNKNTRPTASGKLKPKKQKIKFKWSKVAGADGYQIYWYNPAKEKYVLKHTVKGANKTSFAGKISKYHKSYTFKIRAYTVKPNKKTKVYSKYSEVFTVDVP